MKSIDKISLIIGLILTYIVALVCILIITIIVPIEDDPPIYHYPFMVYLECGLVLVVLLLLIVGVLLRKKEVIFKKRNQKEGILNRVLSYIEWEEDIHLWRKITRIISMSLFIGINLIVFGVGIFEYQLLVSPMNMLVLPFNLSIISIWIGMGVKRKNTITLIALFLIVAIVMGLAIGAIAIAQDERILGIVVSHQIIALCLLGIRIFTNVKFKTTSNK